MSSLSPARLSPTNSRARKQKNLSDYENWTYNEVAKWLNQQGFENYAQLIAYDHKIDGRSLSLLTESDLRLPPLQIPVLGDVKRLYKAIRELTYVESTNRIGNGVSSRSPEASISASLLSPSTSTTKCDTPSYNNNNKPEKSIDSPERKTPSSTSVGVHTDNSLKGDLIIARVESPDTPTKSLIKTAISALYCSISLLITSLVMVIVHDRVPDMKTYPPLPDLFLDNVPLIPWAFEVCELLACSLGSIWFITLVFHKHRLILLCRMFSLVGTVFLLRCITMLITSLSVPGVHLECAAKVNYSDFGAKLQESFVIWSNLGMSLRGVRSCGDYMFSGHTTAITLLNHFITEYTPDSFLHTITWVMNLFGVFFILAGHEHYSIDVFVAFYISSRLFLYYHSMASQGTAIDHRTRIWFPLFWLFESGRSGRVPNEFEWPFPTFTQVHTWVLRRMGSSDCFLDDNNLRPDSDNDYKQSGKAHERRASKSTNSHKKRNFKQKAKGD